MTNNIEHFYQSIDGWFNYPTIYKNIVRLSTDGAHIVEVGAWKGKSTSFLAVEIANSGKSIKFDVVDTWAGSVEHRNELIVQQNLLFDEFKKNIKPVEQYINIKRMTSLEAAATYEDNSLDFVMLDASHEYGDIKNDIEYWFPKIKPGGVLSGDDFHLDWPGVIRAVQETFTNFHILDTRTWAVIKK